MVLLLPKVKSFGETIGESFGGGVGKGFSESLKENREREISSQELAQENAEIKSKTGIDLSGIKDPNLRRAKFLEELKGQQPEKPLSPLQQSQMAINEARLKQIEEQTKQLQGKPAEEAKGVQEIKNRAQKAFNGIAEILHGGNVGMFSPTKGQIFGGKTAEDVGKFTSLTGALESILVDMVSKGRLSNARFQYITEQLLPKPGDREATIKGKLKGLAEILELDPSILEGKGIKKIQPGLGEMSERPSLSSFER